MLPVASWSERSRIAHGERQRQAWEGHEVLGSCVAFALRGGMGMQQRQECGKDAGCRPIEFIQRLYQPRKTIPCQGRDDVASKNFKFALDTDARNSEAHHAIGVPYERLGQKDLAAAHLKRSVAMRSSNASAQTDYGSFLCAQGLYAEADDHFRTASLIPLLQASLGGHDECGYLCPPGRALPS